MYAGLFLITESRVSDQFLRTSVALNVFIDTPPANVVTDAFLLNTRTAGVILVIKEGHTTHDEIRECLEKAKMTNCRILGFIKANCLGRSAKGGYKYKYKYKNNYYKYSEYK